jgi:Sporulation and spore germination
VIPRYQRILFWILVVCILVMAFFLGRGAYQANKRLTAVEDATPIAAPTHSAGDEDITLYLASDADGSITATTAHFALPQEPTLRARALLQNLLSEYGQPNSSHPLQSGPNVDDVFLLNLPSTAPPAFGATSGPAPQLAVINLHASFADNHPSGISAEDLTLQSIIGTLHNAFPQVAQIRFLVDGQPRDTLAGHADLTRAYPAIDTAYKPVQPQPQTASSQ